MIPSPKLTRIMTLMVCVLLLSLSAGCVGLDECSSDSDCAQGLVCVRASAGWSASSFCGSLTDGSVEADTAGCSFPCAVPLDGATCLADQETVCALACPPGRGDCDGDLANGCETDLLGAANDCGACGTSCDEQLGWKTLGACVDGACVAERCEEGYYDLDQNLDDGCELGFDEGEARDLAVGSGDGIVAIDRTPSGTLLGRSGPQTWLQWIADDGTANHTVMLGPGISLAGVWAEDGPTYPVFAALGASASDGIWLVDGVPGDLTLKARLTPQSEAFAATLTLAFAPAYGGGDLMVADGGTLSRHRLQATGGADCEPGLDGNDFVCLAGSAALDLGDVRAMRSLSMGDSQLVVAVSDSDLAQFRILSDLVGEQTATSSTEATGVPVDVEPWVDSAQVPRGVAVLEATRVAFVEFAFSGDVLLSRTIRTTRPLPVGAVVHDLVPLGSGHFAVLTNSELLLLGADDDETLVLPVDLSSNGDWWTVAAAAGEQLVLANGSQARLVPILSQP